MRLNLAQALPLGLLALALVGGPAAYPQDSRGCVGPLKSALRRLMGDATIKVESPAQVRALSPRPARLILVHPSPGDPMRLAELGYVLDYKTAEKGSRLTFVHEPALVSDLESEAAPAYIEHQREELHEYFSHSANGLQPSNRQIEFAQVPEQQYLLTRKTLQSIPPSRYSFVVLEGENFLRIGSGHHRLGARRAASSAGEVEIRVNSQTGLKEVVAINNRSDTYRPMPYDLVPAVEAIWRQGIFPTELDLLDWDHRTLLLHLR